MLDSEEICRCYCRTSIRFILRAFTENELNSEEKVEITLQDAMEKIDKINMEYDNERDGYYHNFANYLRRHLSNPASILETLKTCRCCERHQENREMTGWTIFNASETLPGYPMALEIGTDTEMELEIESESETDYSEEN